VARNKVRFGDEVSRFNGSFAETQVRNSNAARFFTVVSEVSLNFVIGAFADNFS
jgi:hypothetical protein